MDKKRKELCKQKKVESVTKDSKRNLRSSLHTGHSSEVKPKRVTFEVDVLKTELEKNYLCLFPDQFFLFWRHIQMLAGKDDDPCGIYNSLKRLRLCGVFDYLAGHLKDADPEQCLLHDRFTTDLPEMQTLATYENGRFAYWRDEPNTEKPLIVHVDNTEHFPKCDIVGFVDPFYVIAYLIGNTLPARFRSLFSKDWVENYKIFTANVKTVIRSRKKETVGLPFHGLGIYVQVVDSVGYRPIGEKTGKLKEVINVIATTSSEDVKQEKLEKIMEIVSYVQFANDEKDFGMGLEFGHDVFWSNHSFFDKMAEKILSTAYKLLGREAFARILEIHMPSRRNVSVDF